MGVLPLSVEKEKRTAWRGKKSKKVEPLLLFEVKFLVTVGRGE